MDERSDAFVGRLVHYHDISDRRALAALRRGLGKPPGTAMEMMPYVVPFLPAPDFSHWAYFTVASLFGLHPVQRPGLGMGSMCRLVVDNDSGEKRFSGLLDAHRDELPGHLRRMVSIARQKNCGLDYALLLKDLLAWTHPDRYVQRRWARQFWAPGATRENENSPIKTEE